MLFVLITPCYRIHKQHPCAPFLFLLLSYKLSDAFPNFYLIKSYYKIHTYSFFIFLKSTFKPLSLFFSRFLFFSPVFSFFLKIDGFSTCIQGPLANCQKLSKIIKNYQKMSSVKKRDFLTGSSDL